jgi:hypothetical protein
MAVIADVGKIRSKWEDPVKLKMNVHQFLHLAGQKAAYTDGLLRNDAPGQRTVTDTDAVGTEGSHLNAVFDYLKIYAAKVKHSKKYANKDKNFTVLPGSFTNAALEFDWSGMDRIYARYSKEDRKTAPWKYNKILIAGNFRVVNPRNHSDQWDHACLVVIWFYPNRINIKAYDVGPTRPGDETNYQIELDSIKGWLEDRKYTNGVPVNILRSTLQPHMHDGWNCSQYMIEFAKEIMRERVPAEDSVHLQHLKIPHSEPEWDVNKDKLYRKNRKRRGVLVHPELDKKVVYFNVKRRRRSQKLMDYRRKPMHKLFEKWQN